MDNRQRMLAQVAEYSVETLPRAWNGVLSKGLIKTEPADFFVDEVLGFEPCGEGEHVFVHIEKKGLNTQQVADLLRRETGVPQIAVSFAGMKDRHAVTRQWFSIHLPGQASPKLDHLNSETLKILSQCRHNRKLRRGALRGNRFKLVVRDFKGDVERAGECLDQIGSYGFPNYFGVQRFGRDNANLLDAVDLFLGHRRMGRTKRSLSLSAARSYVFNRVLAERVGNGTWNQPLEGEVFQKDGSNSLFREASIDDELRDRCGRIEIHPTGPLWGRGGRVVPEQACAELERKLADDVSQFCIGLEKAGLEADRRPCRARTENLDWSFESGNWELSFGLARGCYATSLMREWLQDF